MVVEDYFVTTLPAGEALSVTQAILSADGFRDIVGAAQNPNAGASLLYMKRGKPMLQRKASVRDLPQEIRLEYDRGRVNIAASIHRRGKERYAHAELLIALLTTIRLLLTGQLPIEQARATLSELESELDARTPIPQSAAYILAGVLLAVLAILALFVVAALTML